MFPRLTRRAKLVTFALGIVIALGTFGAFVGEYRTEGRERKLTRDYGIPGSPWLIASCQQFRSAQDLECEEWSYSAQPKSWSWGCLAIAVFALAGLIRTLRRERTRI